MDSGDVEAVFAATTSVRGPDGSPMRRVKLVPYGSSPGRANTGPFVVAGRAHAHEVIQATRLFQGDNDLIFDLDHQTVWNKHGLSALAGTIKINSLVAEGDGIYGNVDWTHVADKAIRDQEYRYHSPYCRVDGGSGRVVRLVSAGLTNVTNLDAPVLSSVGAVAAGRLTPEEQQSRLTEEEAAICAQTGVSEHDYLRTRDKKGSVMSEEEQKMCWLLGLSEEQFSTLRRNLIGGGVSRMEGDVIYGHPHDTQSRHARNIAGKLTDEEAVICAQTGVSEGDYLRTRDAVRA